MKSVNTTSRLCLMFMLGPVVAAGGCAAPDQPRYRAGSIPYPGLLTLYATAEPDDLGEHRYGAVNPLEPKASRGIIYTKRGGFIDIAHIRHTIDWAWYYHQRIEAALWAGQDRVALPAHNNECRIHVSFNYPPDWGDLPTEQREGYIEQLAFYLGQEAAFHEGTWHEIATWFGYATTGFFSEYDSAFAYDDTFSHVIGVRVLHRARDDEGVDIHTDYDAAITEALDEEVQRLEPVSAAETDRWVEKVRGRWWDEHTGTLRRYLEIALEDEALRPWIAAEEPGAPGEWGEPVEIPRLTAIDGRDFTGFADMRVEPGIWEGDDILAAADADESTLCVEEDFAAIMDHIRVKNADRYGEDADQP